ncbi:MAG: Stp1/IreP family PP2C-type Ser/Thr phosphatase [Bacillota bacterium]
MRYGLVSDVGKVRDENEDSYLKLITDDYGLFAVADGMGGHNAGEVASTLAVDTLKAYNFTIGQLTTDLETAVKRANRQILQAAKENPKYQGMGTTLTAALLTSQQVYIGHVGDSRAYLFRAGELIQLTEDHSLVNQLLESGEITEQEARNHPQRNLLLQALGTAEDIEVDIISQQIKEDDLFLLCSDGLTDLLSDQEIAKVLDPTGKLQQQADQLVQLAKQAGGYDNITVNLLAVS